jgi:hypothetical protein
MATMPSQRMTNVSTTSDRLCMCVSENDFLTLNVFLDLEFPAYLFGIESSYLREKLIRFVIFIELYFSTAFWIHSNKTEVAST